MHEKYDLKGSTHGRTASERETSKGVRTIFKDNVRSSVHRISQPQPGVGRGLTRGGRVRAPY